MSGTITGVRCDLKATSNDTRRLDCVSNQARLTPLVEAAEQNEPYGVKAVDGDSGYYRSKDVVALISKGVDVCVPDSVTALELHRGLVLGSLSSRHRAVS